MIDVSQFPISALAQTENPLAGAAPPAAPAEAPAPTAPEMPVSAGGLSPLSGIPASAPGSFGSKLARALDKTPLTLQPDGKPEPGSWARSIIGGAQTALAGLGDAATKPGGGALSGIVETIQNRNARIQTQKELQDKKTQQEFENKQSQNRNDVLNAYTQAQTVALQRSASRLDEEAMDKHVAAGKAATDAFRAHHAVIGEGVTEDQMLPEFKPGGKYDPSKVIGYQTGMTQVERNGKLVSEPTYTIFQRQGGPVTVTADAAKLLSQYSGSPVPEGTQLDGDTFDHMMTSASAAQATANLLKKQNREEDLAVLTADQTKQHAADLAAVNPWMGAHRDDPITALDHLAQQKGKDGQATQQALAAGRILQSYKESDLETHRKNVADEKAKQQELSIKKSEQGNDENNPSGLVMTPEMAAKIAALPQPQRDLLSHYDINTQAQLYSTAFGLDDGYRIFPNRVTKGGKGLTSTQAFGLAQQINPAFDPSRAKVYQDTRKAFSEGKEAKAINNLNTAVGHLTDLYNHTTAASTTPGISWFSKVSGGDAAKMEGDLTRVASEMASAYKGGAAPTETEIEDQRKSLQGSTYWEQRSKIREAAHNIESKLGGFKHQWEQGSVPGTNPPFQIVSDDARNQLNMLQGEPQHPAAQNQPPVPTGMVRIQDSQGGFHNIPQDKVDAAKQRDPHLQVIPNPSVGAAANATAAPQPYQQSKEFVPSPSDIPVFKSWSSTGPQNVPGMIRPGNIDLSRRPVVHHSDGSVSTLYSGSDSLSAFTGNPNDKGEVLVPWVTQDGKMLSSQKEAFAYAHKTGQILGIFKTAADADRYAEMLHLKQGAFQVWKNGGKYNPSVETYDNWHDEH